MQWKCAQLRLIFATGANPGGNFYSDFDEI